MSDELIRNGLAALRAPFEPHQVGKLPKPTKAQTNRAAKILREQGFSVKHGKQAKLYEFPCPIA